MNWLSQQWIETLGWTLLHSLWQLSGIAAICAVAMILMRRASSHVRYAIFYFVLIAMIAVPIATYVYLWEHRPVFRMTTDAPAAHSVAADMPASSAVDFSQPLSAPSRPAPATWQWTEQKLGPVLPYAALAYLLGGVGLTLRLLLGFSALRRVRLASIPAMQHHNLLAQLRERLRISSPVLLLQSARVEVPTVIGAFRPIILLPLSAVTGLSTEYLTHLLLHELAHIRRHDYAANLLQSVIETLLFYHPGVIWLSAVIRQEREHCCDDIAVAAAGSRAGYAAALATMESLRASPLLAVSARGGLLLSRIRRILQVPVPRSPAQRIINTTSVLLFFSMIAIALTWYLAACSRNDVPPPTTAPATAAAASAMTAPSPNRAAQIGDVLEIKIYELIAPAEFNTDLYAVDENGKVRVFAIGEISAAGKTPRQLEDVIARAAVDRSILSHAEVRVAFTDQHADLRPLESGDRVICKVYELEQPGQFFTDSVIVDENGEMPVLHLGRIHLAGLTPTQAAARVASQLSEKQILRAPADVRVSRTIR